MKKNRGDKRELSRRQFVKTTAAGMGAVAVNGLASTAAEAQGRRAKWDKEADVVVVGAGATGLPAAIEAKEDGASVIVIDANFDVGGHAIVSGGNVALGGGTSRQKRYGVVDSPDLVFSDLTDWSVVEPNGFPDYRRQLCAQPGIPDRSRRHLYRAGSGCLWRACHGKFRSAGEPRGRHGVASSRNGRARGPCKGCDYFLGHRSDPTA
jgi:FAD binding domain